MKAKKTENTEELVAQTVRIPKKWNVPGSALKHSLAATGESFQMMAVRLVKAEIDRITASGTSADSTSDMVLGSDEHRLMAVFADMLRDTSNDTQRKQALSAIESWKRDRDAKAHAHGTAKQEAAGPSKVTRRA